MAQFVAGAPRERAWFGGRKALALALMTLATLPGGAALAQAPQGQAPQAQTPPQTAPQTPPPTPQPAPRAQAPQPPAPRVIPPTPPAPVPPTPPQTRREGAPAPGPQARPENGPGKSGGPSAERPRTRGMYECTSEMPERLPVSRDEAEVLPPLYPDRPLCVQLWRGQSAFFRVAEEAGRSYTVITRNLDRGTDTVLAALDPRGRVLVEDDDGGGQDLSSRLEIAPEQRVALLRASTLGDTGGNFELLLVKTDPPPPADFATTLEDAASRPALEPGMSRSLRLRRNQSAYFALPSDRAGLVAVTRNLRNNTDTILALLDENGTVIAENDDVGNSLASELPLYDPPDGRLVLRVSTYERMPGHFDLLLLRETPRPPPPFPTNLRTARQRPPLQPGRQTLELDPRQTAYFALPQDGQYTIETRELQGDTDTVLALLDENGRVLAEDDDGGQGFASRINTRRARQRPAFLRITLLNPGGGRFDLVVQGSGGNAGGGRTGGSAGGSAGGAVPAQGEPARDIAAAARRPALVLGEAVSLELLDRQAAVYALPNDGRPLLAMTYNLGAESDSVLEWLDENGTVLAENDDAEGLASRLAIAPTPRPSYLRVSQIGRGGTVSLVLVRPSPQDAEGGGGEGDKN
ncbi:hypothetical protein [Pseudoroseomonas cervicalis]|uniref:hypothetical protein n=1 Tax=Teichococcus cervicalis TaxID=204525 RepID=UPI0027839FEE|nr:hypothetical protein [Pseudoroseomonas cervicalis]MDQ1078026.1 hypothetical protein [Pseudoroseomonas cervicalis]